MIRNILFFTVLCFVIVTCSQEKISRELTRGNVETLLGGSDGNKSWTLMREGTRVLPTCQEQLIYQFGVTISSDTGDLLIITPSDLCALGHKDTLADTLRYKWTFNDLQKEIFDDTVLFIDAASNAFQVRFEAMSPLQILLKPLKSASPQTILLDSSK